ncbi:MAG: monovalent cation/H(+) antiporter subunit G [Verrucomicrobiota bacterium]
MNLLVSLIIVSGTLFVLVAALGIVRFPDLYMRMHAATKAGAFGGSLIFIGCGLHLNQLAVWIEVALIITFFFLTAPIAAQMIGRAGYLLKVEPWSQTKTDSLKGKYDCKSGELLPAKPIEKEKK